MSESMTRGADVLLVQGATVRLDRTGMAATMPLSGCDAGPVPLVLDAGRFAGLLSMGITHVDAARDALNIATATGLRARLPTLADPHRTLTLSLGEEHQHIAPELFNEWLDAALQVAAASGAAVVHSYRSHVFAFDRLALVAVRLNAGWPMPGVMEVAPLREARRHFAEGAVDSVRATRAALLVQAQGKAVRLEARDAQLAQAPINLLARLKAHQRGCVAQMAAADLEAAVRQVSLIYAAHRVSGKGASADPAMEVRTTARGLVLHTRQASVEIPAEFCDQPDLPTIATTLGALKPMQSCAQFGQTAHLVAYPGRDGADTLVVRTGRAAMFAAAQLKP